MIPPITTVAKGLCTSAPVPTLSAIGMKPKLATSAVINTGRNLVMAPSTMELIKSPVSCSRCLINDSITKNIFDDLENRFNTMYGEKCTGLDQWSTWNSANKKKKQFVVAIKYVPTFLSGSDDIKTALSKVMVKMEEISK